MSFLPLALGAVGTAISAVGAFEQGSYESQVAKNNAIIAKQNAEYAAESGRERASEESLKGAQEQARVTASMAANNVDVNSGSAVDVRESERIKNKLSADTVMNNAELQAYGYRAQEMNFDAQSQQDMAGGIFSGAGDILSGASTLAGGLMGGGSGAGAAGASDALPAGGGEGGSWLVG